MKVERSLRSPTTAGTTMNYRKTQITKPSTRAAEESNAVKTVTAVTGGLSIQSRQSEIEKISLQTLRLREQFTMSTKLRTQSIKPKRTIKMFKNPFVSPDKSLPNRYTPIQKYKEMKSIIAH